MASSLDDEPPPRRRSIACGDPMAARVAAAASMRRRLQCHAGARTAPLAAPYAAPFDVASLTPRLASPPRRSGNNRLLRVAVVVRQRADINIVVRALEVQVLALHV